MKARRRVVLAAVAVATLVLLALGCETSTTTTMPTFTSPLQGTAEAITLERYATRSAVEVNAAQAAAQATAQAGIYEATRVALEEELKRENQWATQQADFATQTAQAAEAAVQATRAETSYRGTATADAMASAATATVDAQRWESTRQALETTRLAEATAGAMALQATIEGATKQASQTAIAEAVMATQAAFQATATRQAQQRDEVLAVGRDYGIPFVLALGLIGLGLIIYVVRQVARRPVVYNRSPLGDAPALAAPMPDGGWNIVDLDRQPGHVTRLLPDGTVAAPQFRSAGQEERTTARDQVVDQATRPKLGKGHKGAQSPALPLAPPPTPPAPGLRSVRMFRRLDQAGRVGAIPPPLLASLAADWETEPGEGI